MSRTGRALWAGALAVLPLCAPVPATSQICTAGMTLDDCLNSIYHANGWEVLAKEDVADWSVAVAAAKWKPESNCAIVKAAAQDAFKRSHLFSNLSQLANLRLFFVEGQFRDTVTAGIHWKIGTNVGEADGS